MILEDDATVETLTAGLAPVLSDPARLSAMSAGSRSVALPDAAARLADMVEAAADGTATRR
jgi:UDP-N-acetylglucosamine--N-acetylmuramyl-(pentapeptide) pyrophosphoryl-undecaprenol N-acetylglucosamine transferase